MNRTTKTVLTVGAVAAVVNVAVAYYTSAARTGRIAGQNKWLDFNDSLVKYNPLALVFPEAARGMPNIPGVPLASNFAPSPVAQVTDQSGGTTTYFG